jgi:capsular polysaccharide export protein
MTAYAEADGRQTAEAFRPDWLPPIGSVLATTDRLLRGWPHAAGFLDAQALVSPRRGARAAGMLLRTGDRPAPGQPHWWIDDGFLRRVVRPGEDPPAVSLLVDDLGPPREAGSESRLERILNDPSLAAHAPRGAALCQRIVSLRLAQDNGGNDVAPALPASGQRRILLVDQRGDDPLLRGAGADAADLLGMAAAAREHAGAEFLLRAVPGGVLTTAASAGHGFIALDPALSDHAVLDLADEVWTVAGEIGFLAVLRALPVTAFGAPFYAGWGLTRDRAGRSAATALARRRPLPLDAFAAGTLALYPRYADPVLRRPITAEAAVDRLADWRERQRGPRRRYLCVGFVPWKRSVARLYLADAAPPLQFTSPAGLRRRPPPPDTVICAWGSELGRDDEARLRAAGHAVLHMEDGFVRSVGLGSDFLLPASLILDGSGLYFDATRPSDLETLLATARFDSPLLARAAALRARLVAARLTKYNFADAIPRPAAAGGRRVVLVPGQVPGDASLRFGEVAVAGNLGLLRAVRAENPDAYIVYKVHPDIASGNRPGGDDLAAAAALADEVTARGDMASWLDLADEIHVATSLAGFEALLRGRRVTTWGLPFYAGWGLTEDRVTTPRRRRRLTLDELVAGALILSPRYADPESRIPCSAEDAVEGLIARRAARPLASPQGGLLARRLRRQMRSAAIVAIEFTRGWQGR